MGSTESKQDIPLSGLRTAAAACAVLGILATAGYLAVQTFTSSRRLSLFGYLPAAVGLLAAIVIAIRRAYLLKSAGDRPKFYDQLPGDYSGQGSGYNPTYPFAFGLSYTTFRESNLSAPASVSRSGSMSTSSGGADTAIR